MSLRYLLDTHVAIRWIVEPKRLSREQRRILEASVARLEPVAFSAVSLLEIAALQESGRFESNLSEVFDVLESMPVFELLPITFEIARESAALRALRDPADRAIVASARVHRLKLLTSDQKIIGSNLANVVA